MKRFTYTITDPVGIHARPAGLLVKQIKTYQSEVLIDKGGEQVNGLRLMALMGLCVKQGDTVTVQVTGADEEQAAEELKRWMEQNL